MRLAQSRYRFLDFGLGLRSAHEPRGHRPPHARDCVHCNPSAEAGTCIVCASLGIGWDKGWMQSEGGSSVDHWSPRDTPTPHDAPNRVSALSNREKLSILLLGPEDGLLRGAGPPQWPRQKEEKAKLSSRHASPTIQNQHGQRRQTAVHHVRFYFACRVPRAAGP